MIEGEGCAIKHELILTANLIAIHERKARFDNTREHDLHALIYFIAVVRRPIWNQQDFSACLFQTFAHLIGPCVFTNRNAKAHTTETHRTRIGPSIEDTLFIENAIVWQVDLVTQALNVAVVEQCDGVVELFLFGPWQANEQCGTTISRFFGQAFQFTLTGSYEGWLQDQILWRIASQKQFRIQNQISALFGGQLSVMTHFLSITGDITKARVGLYDGQTELVFNHHINFKGFSGWKGWPCLLRALIALVLVYRVFVAEKSRSIT